MFLWEFCYWLYSNYWWCNLIKTTELLRGDSDNGEDKVGSEVSIGISGFFKSLIGFGAKAQTDAQLETSFKSESLVKTILQNTILTGFLHRQNWICIHWI